MSLASVYAEPARERLVMRFEESSELRGPYGKSLQLILRAVQRDQAADVVCIYEFETSGVLALRDRTAGTPARPRVANLQMSQATTNWLRQLRTPAHFVQARSELLVNDFPDVVLYPVTSLTVIPLLQDTGVRGLLTVGWETRHQSDAGALARLEAFANSSASLLVKGAEAETSLDLISRIARLESDLADWKIAERAMGVLSQKDWTPQIAFDLQQHVSRVLQAPETARNLRAQLAELESALSDRKVLGKAKAHLQELHGITEEEAYLYLRNQSRRARRRLREVAEEVLGTNTEF